MKLARAILATAVAGSLFAFDYAALADPDAVQAAKQRLDAIQEQASAIEQEAIDAGMKAEAAKRDLARAQQDLTAQKGKVDELADELGAVAVLQMQQGGMDDTMRVLSSATDDSFLESLAVIQSETERSNARMQQLQNDQARLASLQKQADAAKRQMDENFSLLEDRSKEYENKTKEAQRVFDELEAEEQERLRRLQEEEERRRREEAEAAAAAEEARRAAQLSRAELRSTPSASASSDAPSASASASESSSTPMAASSSASEPSASPSATSSAASVNPSTAAASPSTSSASPSPRRASARPSATSATPSETATRRPERTQSATPTATKKPEPKPEPVAAPSGSRAKTVVNAALAQVGKGYRTATMGPSTYDCSGLTSYAYRQVGITLPRTSRAQYSGAGRAVSVSNIQPGDLVFYYSGPSHVAIYIGNGRIVHAANPRSGVTTAGLHSMPIKGVRRVL